MKNVKYYLSLLLSALSIFAPMGAVLYFLIYQLNMDMLIPCVVFAVLCFLVQKPLKRLRWACRRDAEYDEFGLSKSKGHYEDLSKEERDAIDLQRIGDMERILNTTAIKKMKKEGPKDPDAALEAMIGLEPVKEKVREMVARMKFERMEGTKKSNDSMSGRHMVFYGSPGTGKAQPLYSKVLTPNGFVKMGDIKVGDKVISGTGNICTVLGVFPQGLQDVYEITFKDGSKCRCSNEHLWRVQTRVDRTRGTYRILSTSEMKDSLKCESDKRYNYSIDYVAPVEFKEQNFYIHPYLLGVLLGDGCLQRDSVQISIYDKEIYDLVMQFLPDKDYELTLRSKKYPEIHDYTLKYNGKEIHHVSRYANFKPLNYHLELLGLRGCHSDEKFIPSKYLYASIEQRRWLLKGLLDTDGYAERSGIEYTTTSARLKDDVIELVRSLGGYASFSEKQGSYRKNGERIITKRYYRIRIQFTSDNYDCFTLKRKSENYIPKRSSSVVKRFISNIEYVGKEECQCIYRILRRKPRPT